MNPTERTRISDPAAGRRTWLALGVIGGSLALSPLAWRALNSRRPASAIDLHASPRPVPLLRFADAAGRALTLEHFRGRVVLLNIWATWCLPCREEMPALDRLQGLLGGTGFEVLALSVDQAGLAAVRPFFESTGIRHLRPYLDTAGAALSVLATAGVPLTLLIDRDGNEIGRKLGPAAWDDPALVGLIRTHIEAAGQAPAPSSSSFNATEITGVEWGRYAVDHGGAC